MAPGGTGSSNPSSSSEASAANSVRTRELSALPHRFSVESLSAVQVRGCRPRFVGAIRWILVEAIDILMEQVRGLQFERLELNAGTDGAAKPVWLDR